jgi:hypothetical protein
MGACDIGGHDHSAFHTTSGDRPCRTQDTVDSGCTLTPQQGTAEQHRTTQSTADQRVATQRRYDANEVTERSRAQAQASTTDSGGCRSGRATHDSTAERSQAHGGNEAGTRNEAVSTVEDAVPQPEATRERHSKGECDGRDEHEAHNATQRCDAAVTTTTTHHWMSSLLCGRAKDSSTAGVYSTHSVCAAARPT